MDSFYPLNFFQASAGVFGVFALIFGAVSLFNGVRVHAIRMLAIFLVVALSLYANSVGVYFAAVFIIATAVTELEFLQTLAAIIRGNKEYFTFRKETLSSEAKYKSSQAELMELEAVPDVKPDSDEDKRAAQEKSPDVPSVPDEVQSEAKTCQSNDDLESRKEDLIRETSKQPTESAHGKGGFEHHRPLRQNTPLTSKGVSPWSESSKQLYRSIVDRVIKLEDQALNYLQELYGAQIERNVVFQSNDNRLELDGLITRPRRKGYIDNIFEVKYIGAPSKIHALLPQIRHISLKADEYSLMTKRSAMMQLVVILDDDGELSDYEKDLLNAATQKWAIDGLFVLNSNELKGH